MQTIAQRIHDMEAFREEMETIEREFDDERSELFEIDYVQRVALFIQLEDRV